MYIEPQSSFILLQQIPFTSDYEKTIWFDSNIGLYRVFDTDEQYNYMIEHIIPNCNFMNFTYVRDKGTVKVPISVDKIYACNYCMFKNAGFSNKWFYAFVTDKQYVSNDVSEISFEIDVLQTWAGEITSFGECLVEREHVKDDTPGLHTVDEGFDIPSNIEQFVYRVDFGTGEPIHDLVVQGSNNTWSVKILSSPSLLTGVIRGLQKVATSDPDPVALSWKTEVQGNQLVPEQYGVSLVPGSGETIQDVEDRINDYLDALALANSDVDDLQLYPKFFTSVGEVVLDVFEDGVVRPDTYYLHKNQLDEQSYEPKNNKLFTYPYTYLKVSNPDGVSQEYAWENFANGTAAFSFQHYVGNGVSCELVPYLYNNVLYNRDYSIGISDFPKCYAQNKGALGKIIPGLVNIATSVAGGFIPQTVETRNTKKRVIKTTKKTAKQKQFTITANDTATHSYTPAPEPLILDAAKETLNSLSGSPSGNYGGTNDNALVRWGEYGFGFYVMGIKPEYAKMIDGYFSKYGYKVNEYKTPELHTRTRFNYIKTVDCNVYGNMPDECIVAINNIFNTGVTLWHTYSTDDILSDNPVVV